jgi:hydrogenase maturation protease
VSPPEERILVLGLGNPILSDDGVGIHAAQAASSLFSHPQVTFQESSLAGFGFLDTITGFDRVIIADSVNWQKNPAGTITILKSEDLKDQPYLRNFHNLSLAGTLALADQMGLPRPKEIVIFAVEVEDCSTFSEKCTPAVEKAIPEVAARIVGQLKSWLRVGSKKSAVKEVLHD